MELPAADLARIRELYVQGRYRKALEAAAPFGPLREWSNTPARILAGRLANLVRHWCGTQRRDVRLERQLEAEIEESSRIMLDPALLLRQSTPSQRASRREQGVVLAAALDRLPEHYREVLVLHHLQGLSMPEVAGRLGKSLDSVKNVWLRALARLRQVVGETP